MKTNTVTVNREQTTRVHNGWAFLVLALLLIVGDIYLLIFSFLEGIPAVGHPLLLPLVVGVLGIPAWIIFLSGFFTLQPNEARVLLLFGDYRGTVRESGFHWGNPFYSNGKTSAGSPATRSPCAPVR